MNKRFPLALIVLATVVVAGTFSFSATPVYASWSIRLLASSGLFTPVHIEGCDAPYEADQGGYYKTIPFGCASDHVNAVMQLKFALNGTSGPPHLTYAAVYFQTGVFTHAQSCINVDGGADQCDLTSGAEPLGQSAGLSGYIYTLTMRSTDLYTNAYDPTGNQLLFTQIYLAGDGDQPTLCATNCYPVAPTGGVTGTCSDCKYTPVGDMIVDAPKLVNWLVCQLSQIYYCDLRKILLGIWATILGILALIGWINLWFENLIVQLANWTLGLILIVAYWLGGTIQNAVNQLIGAIQGNNVSTIITSGGGTNLFDVLSAFINQLGGAINGLVNGLPSIVGNIVNVLLGLMNEIIQIALGLIGLVEVIINVALSVFTQLLDLLNIIPIILSTFQAAFSSALDVHITGISAFSGNGTGNSTVLDCSNATIFHVCMGFYILDNTIFGGTISLGGNSYGIFSMVFVIAFGFIAAARLMWAVRKLQGLAK